MGIIRRNPKRVKLSLFMNALVFVAGAYQFLEKGKIIFGLVSLCAGILNLGAIKFISLYRRHTELGLILINMTVAAIITIDYFSGGSHYIKYAWAAITLAYLFISVRQAVLFKKNADPDIPGNTG